MDKSQKIQQLERHREKHLDMLKSPSEKRKNDVEFEAWVKREIKRTEKSIEQLKLSLVK